MIDEPGSPAPFVRLATTDDGHAIGEVHAAAWQAGFGHFLDIEFVERAAAGRRNGWQYAIGHALALSNLVLVAGRDARVAAFSQSGRPGDGGAALEIFAFYCHPREWGTGLADALMQETCAVLSTGARRAVLWTPEEALRAHRFYERCGFTPTGRARVEPLSDWQPTPTYEEVVAVEYERLLS
jgi:GNAT superfamily N-acetyltransferase